MIDGLDLGMFAELSKIEKPIYNLEASIKFCHAKGWSPANIGKIMRGKIDPLKEPDFVKKPADIPSSRGPTCAVCKVKMQTDPNPCITCGARLCSTRAGADCANKHNAGHTEQVETWRKSR